MYSDLYLLQKIYVLKNLLIDKDEISFIENMILKRKTKINIDSFSYTENELSRMTDGVQKCYVESLNYCIEVYKIDEEVLWGFDFENELECLVNNFKILKLKIHKEKNTSLSKSAKECLKTIMKEEFIKLILKHYNNETSKH